MRRLERRTFAQQYAGVPRRKRSTAKSTWPGPRQVHRVYADDGKIALDVVSRADEIVEGRELLVPVMAGGRCIAEAPGLLNIRRYCGKELETLPMQLQSLEQSPGAPVEISRGLRALAREVDRVRR